MDAESGTPVGQSSSPTSVSPATQRSATAVLPASSSHSFRLEIGDQTKADRNRTQPDVLLPLGSRTPKMNNLTFPGQGTRIRATTTAAQNEIYKLERRLEKLFQQYTSSHAAYASFISQENVLLDKSHTTAAPLANRLLHPRKQGTGNLHGSESNNITTESQASNTEAASAYLLNNIAEIIKQHPGATRLPMIHDVLGALEVPFLCRPVEGI